MLTVETNGDLSSTNDRGPSLRGSLGSSCGCKIFLSCLWCSSQPRTKYFFPTAHFFTLCVHIAQQPRQAVEPGRLSLNMCLWVRDEQILSFATIISALSGVYCKGTVQYYVFKFKTFPNGASDSLSRMISR
jgi:hypothetical protein